MQRLKGLHPAFYRLQAGNGDLLTAWRDDVGMYYELSDQGDAAEPIQDATALEVGDRVEFNQSVELFHTDCIMPLERGIVTFVDWASGVLSILMEALHVSLGDNTLALVPFQDEDTAACLCVIGRSEPTGHQRHLEAREVLMGVG